MRSLAVLLAIALLGAAPAADPSPAPAAAATDRVAQLVGTWSCRNGYGVTSQMTFRADGNGFASRRVVNGPGGRKQTYTRTFRRNSDGSWAVDLAGSYLMSRDTAPPWTGDAWPVKTRNATEWFAFAGADTLRLSTGETAPATLWELCLRGDTPPDASACITPELPAIVYQAVEPDMPAMAAQQGIQGTVHVRVSLDADSHVIGTAVTSSPSTILNNSAIASARQSTYLTAHHDCKPVPSEYLFAVNYSSR